MLPFRKLLVTLPRSQVRLFSTSTQAAALHKEAEVEHTENYGVNHSVTEHDHHGLKSIEGVQGCLTPLSFQDARKTLKEVFDYSVNGHSVQGIQGGHDDLLDVQSVQTENEESRTNVDAFCCRSHIDLHGHIQSNVPEPFNGEIEHYESPFNFPKSGILLQQKYTNDISDFHPSRKYHTTSIQESGYVASLKSSNLEFDDSPSPQGIQGDDCTLELWMQSCMRYNLPNCDEQLKNIKEGRKTLSQVLEEQDSMIRQIAERYKAVQAKNAYARLNLKLVEPDTPSPQGIQGDDCVRFQLWLENCQRFGLSECQEQLNGIKSGRKTLAQVFTEQDATIRAIVTNYYQRRSYSTSSYKKASEVGRDKKSQNLEELSQKDRLKRAVKEYGSTVIVFHIGISLISLGGFYFAVSSGIDLVGLLTKIGLSESVLESKLTTGASTFVVAYAIHKVFAPVRIGITLTSVPFIVRYLRRIGFLKPPKSSF